MAEDKVHDSLKTFLFRLLFLYPLCLAGWWALAGLQVETMTLGAGAILRWLIPDLAIATQAQWETILISVEGPSGQGQVAIDPLVLTRGLPIYLALMLAAPGLRQKPWGVMGGVLTIFAAAMVGFGSEAAIRTAEMAPNVTQPALIPAAFIQILAKSIATRVLPVGLWLWQSWAFIGGMLRK